MSENLTPEQLAHRFKLSAEELVAYAERKGVCLTITREPLQPLAMGHARHVVEAWPARQQPAPPAPRIGRPDQNHGWVTPRADGRFAKCGGPAICPDCLAEQLEKQSHQPPHPKASVFRYLDDQVHKDMAGFYEALGRTQPLPPKVITGSTPRPISDREWAAQPANLREGCTVHAPVVGDL